MSAFGSLLEGSLTKQGRNVKSWRRRHFLLQSNVLYYFKSERDSTSKGYILFNDVARVEERPSTGTRPNMFAVVGPNRTLLAYADTPREAAEWIHAVRVLVKLHSFRNAFLDGAAAWGVAERFLRRTVEHGRRCVELVVQITGHLRAVAACPQRRDQAAVVRERAAAIGFEGVALAAALLEVVRAPFGPERRAELCGVARKCAASCEAMLAVAKGTPEDESLATAHAKLAAETAELVGDSTPDPRAELAIGVEKVRQAALEAGTIGPDALARVAARFQQSCEAVAHSTQSEAARAALLDLARDAGPVISALAKRSAQPTASPPPVDPPEVASARAALDSFLTRVLAISDQLQ
jgi:hypothetical protein